ncbi:hypothetical protein F3N42_10600 [Marinihelvus fidelis]|uniref:Uncharacterized protein n=1 Tax=Marinihelvus fidelis TaxID=2613842 RepID=A0A5N0T752_9GAMM|nr:hypothetical protein F3N42_10600 [Marinihelvus fidelis]
MKRSAPPNSRNIVPRIANQPVLPAVVGMTGSGSGSGAGGGGGGGGVGAASATSGSGSGNERFGR